MNWFILNALFLSSCGWPWTYGGKPQSKGSFTLDHPGFVTLFKNTSGSRTTYDLLVSSFSADPFSSDGVYIVRNVGGNLGNISSLRPVLVTNDVKWPNEVQQVPDAVFGRSVITVSGGFLVPLKTDGYIKLIDMTSRPFVANDIARETGKDWFYHKVQWVDMDKDGDLDILTCRARKPIFRSSEGQLLWLENPRNHSMKDPWEKHVLAEGPDIFFHHTTLNNSGTPTEFIFTSGYFSKVLSVYYLTSGNAWSDSSTVNSRKIDSKIGSVFDVKVEDVNQDGSPELMVTTNNENGTAGTVHFYTIPNDAKNGVYQRHDIKGLWYTPRTAGLGKGAPGAAFVIPSNARNKPLDILLSGDDGGRAYILTPTSTVPGSFAYNSTAFADVGRGTVGQLAFTDVDGDGSLEIFVPDYDNGKIDVYSYTQ